MKKTLLILILTLGMCSINVNAQMRELKTEENGYQWYEIYKDGQEKVIKTIRDYAFQTVTMSSAMRKVINYFRL